MPTLRQLEYLVAVADIRHFGRAAERVHVTQPTLIEQLKTLEQRLGVQLVEATQHHACGPTSLREREFNRWDRRHRTESLGIPIQPLRSRSWIYIQQLLKEPESRAAWC